MPSAGTLGLGVGKLNQRLRCHFLAPSQSPFRFAPSLVGEGANSTALVILLGYPEVT